MSTQTQEDTAFRVMRLLQANPELDHELGVSVGGLNYCLKALIDKGWVKMQNFSQSKNKFGYVYILTPHRHGRKSCSHQPLPQTQDERIRGPQGRD